MKTMIRVMLCVAALSHGCTPYGRLGLMGGYHESRLDSTTFRVTATGNGFTPRDRVLDMLHLRCAEVTREAGYDYFEVLSGDLETVDRKYRAVSLIRLSKVMRPAGAFDAREVIKYLRPQVAGEK